MEIEHAGTSYRTCAHILRELNMQAHHTKLVHISYRNWTCRHRPYTIQRLCKYLMGIEHV